ncbi:MAG: NACHT domain-containing protein [Synechococcales cyanobacterium M58_A2018_015]|nr:NACHT domain-containing protein [Synechococcales cyanobacterium M58_A2018_015]
MSCLLEDEGMTAEEALVLLDEVLQQNGLNDVQEIVFRRCWDGQTYAEIAEIAGYDTGYIKDVGSKLWQLLSRALGEKVTKTNIQAVLRRYQSRVADAPLRMATTSTITANPVVPAAGTALARAHCDWGEAVDVPIFYGRTEELQTLHQWLGGNTPNQPCRVVSLLGMGGIGKTSLSVKLARELSEAGAANLQFVIWCSLRNAPPVEELLAEWIQILSQEQETAADLPTDLNGRLVRLIHYLRASRSLLILDNLETILRSGDYSGYFRPEHEGYGELLKRVAELPHSSTVLITSRENPRVLMALEGETLPVRALRLSGLTEAAARRILLAKGQFDGSPEEWQELTRRYAGNPLALKIVASTIQELFDGSIAQFLAEGATVFDDIRYLLTQQFDRLPPLEQSLMYWLAMAREPVSLSELQADLVPPVPRTRLIEAVSDLRWRSLIDKNINHYTQQPVVMEYVTERFVEQMSEALVTGNLRLLTQHALIKAPVKDYLRESQIRVILEPLLNRLSDRWGSKSAIEQQLQQVLQQLQSEYGCSAGYGGGNLLNLFRQLGTDLTGYDFSGLPIWQAYLQDVELHDVDFSGSQLSQSVFAQTLGSILSVAFSPDGQLLASSDADGEIRLWRVSDGQQLFSCKETQNQWVWSLCFSPDSRLLASSHEDQTVRLWDVATGECVQELRGHTNWVFAVAFGPTGETLISGSEDQTIRLWDVESGICRQTLTGHSGGVRSVAINATGTQIASGSSDQTVRLWSLVAGTQDSTSQVLSGHTGTVRQVAFAPQRDANSPEWLASGGDDATLRLWNVKRGECQREFACGSRIWSLSFSPNGQFLATGSDDQRLRLWELTTEEPIRVFQGHQSMVLAVTFSPDGSLLGSGSDDQTIKLWEVDTGRCLKTLRGYNNWVWSLAANSDGTQLASGHEDHLIRLWDTQTGRCTQLLQGHSGRIWSVAYRPGGGILASGSDDQTIKFWQLGSPQTPPHAIGRCLKTLRGQTGVVRLVVFSPDGQILASNSGDQVVKLWDVGFLDGNVDPSRLGRVSAGREGEWVSGQFVSVLPVQSRVFSIAFSPDSQQVATGGNDQTIRLWDVQTGTCLRILTGHSKPVESVAFHPQGILLASASDDETVRLWDPVAGKCLEVLSANLGRVLAVAFSPDGSVLAGCGTQQTVALWNVKTRTCLGILSGHSKSVQTLAFLSSTVLASGSEDETLRLWDLTQQRCLKILRPDRPYEGLNLTNATGLTSAQRMTLKALGAIED